MDGSHGTLLTKLPRHPGPEQSLIDLKWLLLFCQGQCLREFSEDAGQLKAKDPLLVSTYPGELAAIVGLTVQLVWALFHFLRVQYAKGLEASQHDPGLPTGGVLKALVAFHWHADCIVVEAAA